MKILLSAILLALISGFVLSVDYVFDNDHKNASEDIRLGILKNANFKDWYVYSDSGG